MGDAIAALFSVQWGTVSLIELLWTVGAPCAMLTAFGAIWRTRRRSAYLRALPGLDAYSRRLASRDMFFRRAALGLVLEVALFLGLWSMLEPQSATVTSSAAIAGFAFWLVELDIIVVVIHEEVIGWLIRRHAGIE